MAHTGTEEKKRKKIKRSIAGGIYFVLGVVFLGLSLDSLNIFHLNTLKNLLKTPIFLWCIAYTSVGISAGLINTRNHKYSNWWSQHVLYCGFVLVVVSLFSFAIPLFSLGPVYKEFEIKFYTLSALIGLTGGFLVDIFRDLIIVWFEKKDLLNKEDN